MKLSLSDFTNLEQVGSGGASTVYRATALIPLPSYITRIHRSPSYSTLFPNLDDESNISNSQSSEDNVVAIKVLKSDGSGMQLTDAAREVGLISMVSHQNVLKALGYFEESNSIYIVTEYCGRGTLHSLMRTQFCGTLSEEITPIYASFILRGLKALHSLKIVHRDIKCSNLLLGKRAGMVISDFGVAIQLDNEQFRKEEKDVVGTAYFMAPEILLGEGCSTASDIWSFGCTIIEMLQSVPYGFYEYKPKDYMEKLSRGEVQPVPPKGCSEELRDFLYHCLQRDPSKRATATALLRHAWINFKGLDPHFDPYASDSIVDSLKVSKHADRRDRMKFDSGYEEIDILSPLAQSPPSPHKPLTRSQSLKNTHGPRPIPWRPSRSIDLDRGIPPKPPPKDLPSPPSSPPPFFGAGSPDFSKPASSSSPREYPVPFGVNIKSRIPKNLTSFSPLPSPPLPSPPESPSFPNPEQSPLPRPSKSVPASSSTLSHLLKRPELFSSGSPSPLLKNLISPILTASPSSSTPPSPLEHPSVFADESSVASFRQHFEAQTIEVVPEVTGQRGFGFAGVNVPGMVVEPVERRSTTPVASSLQDQRPNNVSGRKQIRRPLFDGFAPPPSTTDKNPWGKMKKWMANGGLRKGPEVGNES